MYTREQLRKELERCLQANSRIAVRLKELDSLNNDFKCGKRDSAPCTADWITIFQERDIINTRMREIKKIAFDLLH